MHPSRHKTIFRTVDSIDTANPIIREIHRLAGEGAVVKGIHASDRSSPLHQVEFRLADGSSSAFHFAARNDHQFHSFFMEAFRLITFRHHPRWGISHKTAERRRVR